MALKISYSYKGQPRLIQYANDKYHDIYEAIAAEEGVDLRAYLAMEQNGESFSDFVWAFVNNDPQVTEATTLAEIPAATPASDALSKALKKRGFKFVGSTICYAFMQACGLVNDHVTGCFCHPGGHHDPQMAK